MADVKNIDEKRLIEEIEHEAKYARQRIDEAAQRAIAAVKDATAGLRELPDSAHELFMKATALYTCEMGFRNANGGGHPEVILSVNGFGGNITHVLGDAHPLFTKDKESVQYYRVLVAFLPTKKATSRP
jgi:hypothetical protein